MPKRKTYQKPRIVYQKEIETLAGICTSAYEGDWICQTDYGACTKIIT